MVHVWDILSNIGIYFCLTRWLLNVKKLYRPFSITRSCNVNRIVNSLISQRPKSRWETRSCAISEVKQLESISGFSCLMSSEEWLTNKCDSRSVPALLELFSFAFLSKTYNYQIISIYILVNVNSSKNIFIFWTIYCLVYFGPTSNIRLIFFNTEEFTVV